MSTAGSLSFSSISAPVSSTLNTMESQINSVLGNNNGNLTATDLFNLQMQVSQWSIANETFSTMIKSLKDTLSGTLNKIQ